MDQNNSQNQQKIIPQNTQVQPTRMPVAPKPVLTQQQQLMLAQQQAKQRAAQSQAVIPTTNNQPLVQNTPPKMTPEEYRRLQETYTYTSKKNFVADSGAVLLLAAGAVSVVIYIITRLL